MSEETTHRVIDHSIEWEVNVSHVLILLVVLYLAVNTDVLPEVLKAAKNT